MLNYQHFICSGICYFSVSSHIFFRYKIAKICKNLPNTSKHMHTQMHTHTLSEGFFFNELNSRLVYLTSFVCGQNTQTPCYSLFFTMLFSNWKKKVSVLKDIQDPSAQKWLWKRTILTKPHSVE